MREKRLLPRPGETAHYHLISRIVAGDHLLGPAAKEVLRRAIWLVAERCGIEIVTYQVMDNHVHIVVYVPPGRPLSDEELVRRYRLLHPVQADWQRRDDEYLGRMLAANGENAQAWRDAEMRKMGNISEYMKLLKQRFSIWFNRTHNRFGTLWAERFKSVLIESGSTLLIIAAYVDLNCVRAAICTDPKDYRFGGYAEALAGSALARKGLMRAIGVDDWEEAQRRYRSYLYITAATPRKTGMVLSGRERDEVLAQHGEVPIGELLRVKCRYLTDGVVLGSAAFVKQHVERYRERTGLGQRTEPRAGEGAAAGLTVFRRFREFSAAPV